MRNQTDSMISKLYVSLQVDGKKPLRFFVSPVGFSRPSDAGKLTLSTPVLRPDPEITEYYLRADPKRSCPCWKFTRFTGAFPRRTRRKISYEIRFLASLRKKKLVRRFTVFAANLLAKISRTFSSAVRLPFSKTSAPCTLRSTRPAPESVARTRRQSEAVGKRRNENNFAEFRTLVRYVRPDSRSYRRVSETRSVRVHIVCHFTSTEHTSLSL